MDWATILFVAAGAIGGGMIGRRMDPGDRHRLGRRMLAVGVVLVAVTVIVARVNG